MGFKIKKIIAFMLNMLGILDLLINLEDKKLRKRYVRIINYHNNHSYSTRNFEKQVMWLKKYYENISYNMFKDIVEKKQMFNMERPGVMMTFDDGLEGNYLFGRYIMNKHRMTGYYLVSSDLIGKEGYMSEEQIRTLLAEGHVIGCHTSTHHRMNKNDSIATLRHEIIDSKRKLEEICAREIEIFCWCGGEENTYTVEAARMIKKAGYKYGFMTNSYPLTSDTDRYHIQRINVEDDWPVYLMKFQISGIMDWKFKRKRMRVNKITR